MEDIKRIALVGCGSQAKYACEIYSLIDGYKVTHVLSPECENAVPWLRHYDAQHVQGKHKILDLIEQDRIDAALICVSSAVYKKKLYEDYIKGKVDYVTAIHPKAVVASTANISEGVLINAGAVIQPFAQIGMGSMIHANVIVEHDCKIGDWANLAPGCKLAGWVQVGEGATVFTGASVLPTIKIGKRAIVGAGAVVIEDVNHEAVVVGVPARPVLKQ